MKPAPRRWHLDESTALLGFTPILGTVLAHRGYDAATAANFLNPQSFNDPFQLWGMDKAVQILTNFIREKKRIAVYGDYDADGVTACALLTRALRLARADVIPYIPNRMTEGYGLHAAALHELVANGVECVITVDCGTSSVDVVRERPSGLSLIITDHHLPLSPDGNEVHLPPADALINPKQPQCNYPFDGLAGAGVTWKLVQAMEKSKLCPEGTADELVALAALGTVADMMPLRGENRAIVSAGLKVMSAHPLPGLRALADIAGVSMPLRATDLGFSLAPRINAAGRMEDAKLALQLCLSDDLEEARLLAVQLDAQNTTRKEALAVALHEAEQRVAEIPDDAPVIALADASWPMGVVGLVAGRLTERYACPTFIASLQGDEGKGSARSIPGLHLVRALDGAASTLIRYGGHAGAAGFSVDPARFNEFAERIAESVVTQIGHIKKERAFNIDAQIAMRDLTPELCDAFSRLEPCGQGNPEPLVALLNCEVRGTRRFGKEQQHLSVTLSAENINIEAFTFHKPHLEAHLPQGRRVDVCGCIEREFRDGMTRIRLRLRDVRPAQGKKPRGDSADSVSINGVNARIESQRSPLQSLH